MVQISSWSLYDGLGAMHGIIPSTCTPIIRGVALAPLAAHVFAALLPSHGPAQGHQVPWAKGVPKEPGLGFGYDVCRVKRCPDLSAILSVRESPVQLASHFSAIMSLVLGPMGIHSLTSWITDIILKLQTGVASVPPEELAKVLAHRVRSGTCKDPGSKGFDCGLGVTGCLGLDHQAAGGTQI